MTARHGLRAFLNRHGNLAVPASRYGHDTYTCTEVALDAIDALERATGEAGTLLDAEYSMGLVVNDSDDIQYMLDTYPPEDEYDALEPPMLDGRARRIASEWYAGPLYRFVSTGAVDDDVRDEVLELTGSPDAPVYELEVWELAAYMDAAPNRGAVAGWDELWEHDFTRSPIAGTVLCSRCGLLPLDRTDYETECRR